MEYGWKRKCSWFFFAFSLFFFVDFFLSFVPSRKLEWQMKLWKCRKIHYLFYLCCLCNGISVCANRARELFTCISAVCQAQRAGESFGNFVTEKRKEKTYAIEWKTSSRTQREWHKIVIKATTDSTPAKVRVLNLLSLVACLSIDFFLFNANILFYFILVSQVLLLRSLSHSVYLCVNGAVWQIDWKTKSTRVKERERKKKIALIQKKLVLLSALFKHPNNFIEFWIFHNYVNQNHKRKTWRALLKCEIHFISILLEIITREKKPLRIILAFHFTMNGKMLKSGEIHWRTQQHSLANQPPNKQRQEVERNR